MWFKKINICLLHLWAEKMGMWVCLCQSEKVFFNGFCSYFPHGFCCFMFWFRMFTFSDSKENIDNLCHWIQWEIWHVFKSLESSENWSKVTTVTNCALTLASISGVFTAPMSLCQCSSMNTAQSLVFFKTKKCFIFWRNCSHHG